MVPTDTASLCCTMAGSPGLVARPIYDKSAPVNACTSGGGCAAIISRHLASACILVGICSMQRGFCNLMLFIVSFWYV